MYSTTDDPLGLTLYIASPDLLSALQSWHDGVAWRSAPPLIASGGRGRWTGVEAVQVAARGGVGG